MEGSRLEAYIVNFAQERSEENLLLLERALLRENLVVPVANDVKELSPGTFDVPIRAFYEGPAIPSVPAFTQVERLFEWRPDGSKYVTLTGRDLIGMVSKMPSIEQIVINPGSSPRGVVSRGEFNRYLGLT